jgi:starch phosphorylase
MYYKSPAKWLKIMKAGMNDVLPYFDSSRMAQEYYEKMYLKD